jgi:hypothetical protein
MMWVEQVKSNLALKRLLIKNSFSFQIISENQTYQLEIVNKELRVVNDDRVKSNRFIKGSEGVLIPVLSGYVKLREAIRQKKIITNLTFRELLLLESLMYLGKQKQLVMFNLEIS